jgi:hypothetical protein
MVETIAETPSGALARGLQRFADAECRGASPLYEHLARSIAADHELVALAAHARPLALIKIGTSAGRHLLWDQYGYHYGPDALYGNPGRRCRSPAR